MDLNTNHDNQHGRTDFSTVIDANLLIDRVKVLLAVDTDARLCEMLGCTPSAISKARHHVTAMPASILVSMHEETRLPTRQLRAYMGDLRPLLPLRSRAPSAAVSYPSACQITAGKQAGTLLQP